MEDRSNKTIICSVLFLDIVGYSKEAVTGQISLKDRFNTYLSEAIHDVPATDRIILDTGDGAAVNFLGDVESALTAALRLRASLLKEDASIDPPLLVRIGINLGPVRLVRDINGQPNIVGDGINVAQRVMGFADPSQILVSRSYFDAVSRLSDQYTGMFHYQGSRTDKHVREHEIYAIGYPGDQTSVKMPSPEAVEKRPGGFEALLDKLRALPTLAERIKQADAKKRVVFVAIGIVSVLAAALTLMPKKPVTVQSVPAVETMQTASVVPAMQEVKPAEVAKMPEKSAAKMPEKPAAEKVSADKQAALTAAKQKADLAAVKKLVASEKSADARVPGKKADAAKAATEQDDNKAEPLKEVYITVSCKDEVQFFLDGANKGKITTGSLTVTTKPGKHKVILTHSSFGIFTQEVTIEPGKTERIKPKVCN